MLRIDPREVSTGVEEGASERLRRYVWRMSGWHQGWLALLALGVAALGLVPIELQRRIVDDAIVAGERGLLLTLALVYLAAVLAQRLIRLALGLGQGWISESAIRATRRQLTRLLCRRSEGRIASPGRAVSVLGAEVDRLGGFVGQVPSAAVAAAATLFGVLGYMLLVEPQVALVGLALLVPQLVLVPLMQRRLNRLNARHLGQLRDLGDEVVTMQDSADLHAPLRKLYDTRMGIHAWKALMKALLGLASHLAPLGILLWGGLMVIEGTTTLGVVVAFVSGFERMQAPARELIQLYRQTHQVMVQHCMIAAWLDPHDPADPRDDAAMCG